MEGSVKNKHKQESKETLGKVILSNVVSLLKIFFVCVIFVYLSVNFLARPIRVDGGSMFPTFEEHEFGLSNAFSAKFMDINRQDIAVVYDLQMERFLIKRVIGIPGDRIYAKDDKVYVNDKLFEEPYLDNAFADTFRDLNGRFTEDFTEVTLGEDEYFLMGDNRSNSTDSRKLGPFKRSQIKGIHVFVVFPFTRIRII